MNEDRPTLNVRVLPQPTDSVCGPTCLHAVYRFFGDELPLEEIIDAIVPLPQGGSLAVQLGCHALARGYQASIYTNNMQSFDPTWFRPGVSLKDKIKQQAARKPEQEKLQLASRAYLQFLELGGEIKLEALGAELLRSTIDQGLPLLAGLSATYLYDCPRELPDGTFDDVGGEPTGHFVVIKGYDQDSEHILIADPLADNPGFQDRYYSVEIGRLLAAIHLGIVTYDANLLILRPAAKAP